MAHGGGSNVPGDGGVCRQRFVQRDGLREEFVEKIWKPQKIRHLTVETIGVMAC